jgi:topoisomerase-4 subunit A
MSKKAKADHIVAETDVTAAKNGHGKSTIELPLHRRMDHSFLQYASYVIRDRAIPNLADGLKPVQRRILWSLHEKDDGRFIKVATISGHCAQYHPHGEVAISDALWC